MFNRLTVRSKLLSIVAAVAALFGASIWGLSRVARQHVVAAVQSESQRSRQVLSEFFNSRYRQLDAGLRSLVDSPEIRAVLTTEGIDHDTQLMSIVDLQHLLNADVLVYCNEKGRTLARTDDPFDNESFVGDSPLIKKGLAGELARGFWEMNGEHYLAIAFPVAIDEEVKGVVCAALSMEPDAERARSLLLRDVIIERAGTTLTSSIDLQDSSHQDSDSGDAGGNAPSIIQSIDDVWELPRRFVSHGTSDTNAATDEFVVLGVEFAPTDGETLLARVLVPVKDVFGFYSDFMRVLLWAGALTIGLSTLVTYKIGSQIASHVQRTLITLQRVASGDLTARLEIRSSDEFGRIALSLNSAIASASRAVDQLAERQRDTRTLLDSVEDGFFTIDSQGVISDERSGATDRWFGAPTPGMTLWDLVDRFDPNVAQWLELGVCEAFTGLMPVEVILDQLPNRFNANGQSYSLRFSPIRVAGQLKQLAVVINNITAVVENEKLEAARQELTSIVRRVAEDRCGFFEFFNEANHIVDSLADDPKNASVEELQILKRRIHTLKGNASIFGLERIANDCHALEDALRDSVNDGQYGGYDDKMETLVANWKDIQQNIQSLFGNCKRMIQVSERTLTRLADTLRSDGNVSDVADEIESLRLEPTSVRLARIAERANALAKRLGKGDIHVDVAHHDMRLHAERWSHFWCSFVHAVRNAIDHGIETEAERIQRGKPARGTVRLSTKQEDEQFIVSIEDDGRGIDWERITELAYERGLPAESHEDLVNALFAEGLSTTKVATDTSGRGVGMSALRDASADLDGRISVFSQLGIGTKLQISFPSDSTRATLVPCRKEEFAI